MIETNSIVVSGKAFLSSIGEMTEENMGRLYNTENVIFDMEPHFDYLNIRCSRAKKVNKSNWKEFDSASSFRRLPNAYKFALYVADKALCNAKVDSDSNVSVGVFFATGLSAISAVEKFYHPISLGGIEKGSPLLFPNTTSSVGCGLISLRYGFNGKSIAISNAGVSVLQSVDLAISSIQNNEIDYAIVVGTEELTETVYKAFYHIGMLGYGDDKGGIIPYNMKKNNTTILGEGAAALILEKEQNVVNRGLLERTRVGNVESCNVDVNDEFASDIYADTLKRCLKSNNVAMEDVDFVVSSASGNYNLDKCEKDALITIFGDDIPNLIFPSLYFGETDGASGALSIICAIDMMERNQSMKRPVNLNEHFQAIGLNEKVISNYKCALVLSSSYYGDFACTVVKR